MNKKLIYWLIGVLVVITLLPLTILSLYYGGNRDSRLNSAINDFSANHQDLTKELKSVTKVLDVFYLFHQLMPDNLPTYNLAVDPQDLLFLNQNLPESGKLTAEYKQAVAAVFNYQGQNYAAQVRYRGDNPNHWLYAKKSWRIKFDDLFQNQEELDLILPEDRYFFIEPWVAHIGQKLGLVTPELSPVKLTVNGQKQGVYLKAEKWGEQFLINHQLNPDANLYGENEYDHPISNLYASLDNFKKFTAFSSKSKKDKDDLKQLLDLLNQPDDKLFFAQIEGIIDIDNFLKWQAQATLAFSHSQKFSHNLIIYANPDTNKLQFIPWDVAMADEPPVYPDFYYNPLMGRMLTKPEYALRRNQIMWQYLSNPDNLTDDLAYYDKLYQESRGAFYRDNLKIFPDLDFDLRVKKFRQRIIEAHNQLVALLNDARAKVTVKPINDHEATAIIESSGFASLEFAGIEPKSIQVYQDNHLVDFTNPVLIYTVRELPERNERILPKPGQETFKLKSEENIDWSGVKFIVKNAVNQSAVAYEIGN